MEPKRKMGFYNSDQTTDATVEASDLEKLAGCSIIAAVILLSM